MLIFKCSSSYKCFLESAGYISATFKITSTLSSTLQRSLFSLSYHFISCFHWMERLYITFS